MTIDRIDVTPVRLPIDFGRPMPAGWKLDALHAVVAQVYDSGGACGVGYAYTFTPRYMPALTAMTRAVAELLIGADPAPVERHWRRMQQDVAAVSLQGLGQMAIAPLDIALWDLRGKQTGQPVHRLLGSLADRVPAYASTYFAGLSKIDDQIAMAHDLVARGFRTMKLGAIPPERIHAGVGKVRAVREAVGPDIGLMVDCFQGLSRDQALRAGRGLDACGLTWFEDPVSMDDLAGCAELAQAIDTPIAIGEWFYAMASFREVVERRAADILIIDLTRVGGFSGWRRVAAYAAAHAVPVATHLMTEVSAHALAAADSAFTLEYCPWTFPLFCETPDLAEPGYYPLGEAPGLGLELDTDAVDRFRLDR